MTGLARVMTFADLARAAQTGAGPLAPPVKGAGPLDPAAAKECLQIGVADIKRRFLTSTAPDGTRWRPLKYGRPGQSGGAAKPLQDTGRLMASVAGRVGPAGLVWFTNRPGAALMNAGGVVVPRKGRFLAVPLTREAKRAGSPRRLTGTPRVPLFARRVGGRLVGHFLLVRRAVVPRREFMGLSPEALAAIAAALGEHAGRAWEVT